MQPIDIDPFKRENRRAGGIRVKCCNAYLLLDGERVDVPDFSRTGFCADLPASHRTLGAKGRAELHFDTTGFHNVQNVSFEVVRVDPASVGVTYSVEGHQSLPADEV